MSTAEPLLVLEATSKRYGGIEALAGASLVVRPGTVHALLGENGAGKTTLMRIAYGLTQADSGTMRWLGARTHFGSPRDALAAGIAMVQQHFSLVPSLTVADNIALGGRGLYDAEAARRQVRELGAATGLAVHPDAIAGTLGVSAQQRVEILKALARRVKLLILDEPTATLAPDDAAALLAWARGFATGEHAVVLITHKLRDALAIADDVTVLRAGRVVLSSPAAAQTESSLASAMLGGPTTNRDGAPGASDGSARSIQRRDHGDAGPTVAELHDVSSSSARGAPGLVAVTFVACRGEIVGIAAVEGNGERALLRIIAGREKPKTGAVRLPERIAYIPQERHADALADELSLTENVALAGAGARRGWIDWPSMRVRAEQLMKRFDVRSDSASVPARALSGGNQQRLVLARELDGNPALVVADQPTRGLDIHATMDVHDRLRKARAGGAAVVLHSADLDEILELADRIVVVVGGHVREASGSREEIGRAVLGVSA